MRRILKIKTILIFSIPAITWLLFSGAINKPPYLPASGYVLEYSILEGSKITVAGTTNINEFACFSAEKYDKSRSTTTFNEARTIIYFHDALLKVASVSLDCGNAAMNSNLTRTLKADKMPYIIIEIQQAGSKDGKPLNLHHQTPLIAKVFISLAGVRRMNEITFTGEELQTGSYHFTGQHHLLLSDYHLEPPEALFGLVKVNDRITVRFDLKVQTKAHEAQ